MSIANADVRMRAIQAYKSKMGTRQQVAAMYGIHPNNLRNWLRAYEAEGRLVPRPRGHMPQAFSEDEKARIKTLIQEKNDITFEEIRTALSKECSLMAVHRELVRSGLRYKKNFKSIRTRAKRCYRAKERVENTPE